MSQTSRPLPTEYALDGYFLEAVLGIGTASISYRAREASGDRRFCIRECFPREVCHRAQDGVGVIIDGEKLFEAERNQFLDQHRSLQNLQLSGILPVEAVLEANNTVYVVIPLGAGESLRAWLTLEDTLPEADLRVILARLLPILRDIHRQGAVFGSLEPDKVYIRARDRAVLLLSTGNQTVSAETVTSFLPPEHLLPVERVHGPWSDLYSLGVLLYRCVSGELPPLASERLLDDRLLAASEVARAHYSEDLLAVVDRCLRLRPRDRFEDVQALADALDLDLEITEALSFPPTEATTVPVAFPEPEPEPEPEIPSAAVPSAVTSTDAPLADPSHEDTDRADDASPTVAIPTSITSVSEQAAMADDDEEHWLDRLGRRLTLSLLAVALVSLLVGAGLLARIIFPTDAAVEEGDSRYVLLADGRTIHRSEQSRTNMDTWAEVRGSQRTGGAVATPDNELTDSRFQVNLDNIEARFGPAPPVDLPVTSAEAAASAIQRLLAQGQQSLEAERYTTPRERSALTYFRQALSLDPGNAEALQGLQRIARGYAELAERQVSRSRFGSAMDFAELGLSIVPQHPELLELREVARSGQAREATTTASNDQG